MTPFGKTPLRGTFDGTNAPTANYKARGEGAAADRKIKAMKISFKDNENFDLQTDGNGTVDGVVEKRAQDEITAEFIIKADSAANARTEVNLPIRHTVVALGKFVANAHTFLNGDWAYHGGGSVELVEGDEEDTKLTLPLKRYFKPDGSAVPLTGAGGMLVAQT